MANELQLALGATGKTLYSVVRNPTGLVWDGSSLVAYNQANWSQYDIAMTEQAGSGYYTGPFPAVAAGVYAVEVRERAGGSPAVGDPLVGGGQVEWDGSAVANPPPAATAVAAAVLDALVESGMSLVEAVRLILAAAAGSTNTAGTLVYAPGTSTTRLTVAANGSGRSVTATP